MAKDIILNHKDISNPQTITDVTREAFKKEGLNMHHHEVTDIAEDFSKGVRRLRVQTPRMFFTVPELPWKVQK